MISKIASIALATVLGLSFSALAQTAPATSPAPNTPSAAAAAPLVAQGTRVAAINIEGAIFSCNEGQRDFEALRKKLEPKQADLKSLNDEIDRLKSQLTTQGDKMNPDAHDKLVKDIENRQKSLQRSQQDFQEEAQAQQGEIAQRILQKMVPVIQQFVVENGYGLLLDTSQQWPQGPVVLAGPSMDITGPVVEAYNVKSGVPAPTNATAKPPAATKPATTPAPKPAGTAPTSKPTGGQR